MNEFIVYGLIIGFIEGLLIGTTTALMIVTVLTVWIFRD